MNALTDEDASITASLLADLGLEIQDLWKQLKARDDRHAVALKLMDDATEVIKGLADQQAMEDNFYMDVLGELDRFAQTYPPVMPKEEL